MSGERKTKSAPKPPAEAPATLETPTQPEVQAPALASPQAPVALAVPDVFPDFAASPDEVTRRTQELKDYVREHMTEGEDYGIIPGGTKPTLFKPGAEKLNAVFGLSPVVEVVNRFEDWDAGFVAYEVKVTLLNKRSGGIEAEGIGSCNSRERRYKNQDAANVSNTILKMAKKRALVDATLSATRASGLFTQDLEDIEFEPRADARRDYAPRTVESTSRREFRAVPQGGERSEAGREHSPASHEVLTDAQHRAILAIAGRVFGRHSREEDLNRLVDKPLEQLSKFEASSLIDRLRGMLGDTPANANPEPVFVRAGERSVRNGAAR